MRLFLYDMTELALLVAGVTGISDALTWVMGG